MSEVKRYNTDIGKFGAVRPYESEHGRWVKHSDYAALEAECERMRVQVSALQSDANSWQSGYDKGRDDGAKAAEGWKAQHARDSAELRKLCAERDALRAELAALKAPVVAGDEREAEKCLFVLREIGSMDADDISGDDIDLRFEDADGRDTGCDVSIVEYAERAADQIERLLAARHEQAEQKPIGYTTPGMLEIAQALPLPGRIGVRCRADERWNVPLYAAPIAQTPADGLAEAFERIVRNADSEPDGDYLEGAVPGSVAVHRALIERARAVLAAHCAGQAQSQRGGE